MNMNRRQLRIVRKSHNSNSSTFANANYLGTTTLVRQSRLDTCWGLGIQSFCTLHLWAELSREIIEEFTHLCNSHLDLKIERNRLKLLFADRRFGLGVEEVSAHYFESTPQFLYQKLKSGYVILGYWENATNGWHLALVYGIKDTSVLFVDPDGATCGYIEQGLDHFSKRGNILVASQKW